GILSSRLTDSCGAPAGKRPAAALRSCQLSAEIPESDRVPKVLHRRDAMFPYRARGTAQQIGGARLCGKRCPLPHVSCLEPEPEFTRYQKRDANDVAKQRLVLAPTNAGAGSILRDEHMFVVRGRTASES